MSKKIDEKIIPFKKCDKTDTELIEELSADNRKMRRLLNSSNILLRSALSIAEREGKQTFWDAFKKRVEQELKLHSDFFIK